MASFVSRIQRPAAGSVDKPAAADAELARDHPALHAHLTAVTYPDGSARKTCSLTLYAQGNGFRAFLNDRDSGAAVAVEATSLAGLLAALEASLVSDDPGWRWYGSQAQTKATKSRK